MIGHALFGFDVGHGARGNSSRTGVAAADGVCVPMCFCFRAMESFVLGGLEIAPPPRAKLPLVGFHQKGFVHATAKAKDEVQTTERA